MSFRHLDPGLRQMVEELYARVKDLERAETRRYSSLRIGNIVIEQYPAYPATPTHIQYTNLSTGAVTQQAL